MHANYIKTIDSKILTLLNESGYLTKKQIAKTIGHPITTVFEHIQVLIKKKQITRTYQSNGKPGRPFSLYCINDEYQNEWKTALEVLEEKGVDIE